jgi:cephalosporin-C deacetylase-like acetyl esterase
MFDISLFEYDRQTPLALTVLSERMQEDTIIQDITYASPHGGKVSGYLIFPSERAPQAGLIFGHWGEGNREEFVQEAVILTRLGFVSLCLDAPYRRLAEYEPQIAEPLQAELQWIVDVRRGVDVLQERFSLTSEQLGYVGHSFSASYGGPIAGIEHRIKAFVLMAGWYSVSEMTRTSMHPVLVEDRNNAPPEEFDAYLLAIAPLDASHYICHAAPSHLFFQFAVGDEFVLPADGQHYFDLASEPKQLAWYDNCAHELSAQARLDRVIWLCEQFNLSVPSRKILDLLEQLPPPQPLED